MNEVRVSRKGAERVTSGHPWIFTSDIADRDGAQAGRPVKVADPRGRHAGLPWPQFSIHRGELQMILFDAARKMLGADKIKLGRRLTGLAQRGGKAIARFGDDTVELSAVVADYTDIVDQNIVNHPLAIDVVQTVGDAPDQVGVGRGILCGCSDA